MDYLTVEFYQILYILYLEEIAANQRLSTISAYALSYILISQKRKL